jgi:U3 small nucleolar RNA-associated protein 14
MKFVQVISFLLQQLSPSFFIKSEDNRGTQMVESEEEDSDDEIKDVDMDVETKKIDELKWADLDSTEQECLAQLHDPDFLSDIVNSLFANHQLNQASEHSAIMLIAELFNLLLIRWPSYRDKVFGLLLYNLKVPYNSSIKQNFVHELCSIWMSGPLSQEIGKLTDAGSSTRVISYITSKSYNSVIRSLG